MTASPNLSHSHSIRKSGVLVLNGWGIGIKVEAGHLLLHDGIADERRTIRLPRVNHGLKRLVLIGSDGFVTFEALRWISDAGASFLMLDRRGKVLVVTGPVTPSDSKLRRAQALALGNGTALKISKELISQKLTGQELRARHAALILRRRDAIARFRSTLPSTESIRGFVSLRHRPPNCIGIRGRIFQSSGPAMMKSSFLPLEKTYRHKFLPLHTVHG